jgi:hypothetical protein
MFLVDKGEYIYWAGRKLPVLEREGGELYVNAA